MISQLTKKGVKGKNQCLLATIIGGEDQSLKYDKLVLHHWYLPTTDYLHIVDYIKYRPAK